jgi:diacylglycerol kinase family enzyme
MDDSTGGTSSLAEDLSRDHRAVRARRRTIVLAVNPRARDRVGETLWDRARERLTMDATILHTGTTAGDADDVARVCERVREHRPDVVVAAGGDGTVNQVVEGLLAAGEPAPALGILPFGIANNVARSLGLLSCRHGGAAAIELAVHTLARGGERVIDLGAVGRRHFVGAFAAGMDADILATRNRYRQRLGAHHALGGYPLYLVSCAVNLLRRHGARGRLEVDGRRREGHVYNLLVLNTAIYAGEFRFVADDPCADGALDLQLMTGPTQYVGHFVAAWRRHLRAGRGMPTEPATGLARARAIDLVCARPVPAQVDGEELPPSDRYAIRVMPRALRVLVPSS